MSKLYQALKATIKDKENIRPSVINHPKEFHVFPSLIACYQIFTCPQKQINAATAIQFKHSI